MIRDVIYSPVYQFEISGLEWGRTIYFVPDVGIVRYTYFSWENRESRELLHYQIEDPITAVGSNSWGRLKQSLDRMPK
jgi:hypothetical protein